MGNILTASIDNQIEPTASYIQEINELRYIKRCVFLLTCMQSKGFIFYSLGATRFLKTVCVESGDGLAVVKIFVLGDQTINVDHYLTKIAHIRRKLRECPNCLPYTRNFVS